MSSFILILSLHSLSLPFAAHASSEKEELIMKPSEFVVTPGKSFRLRSRDSAHTCDYETADAAEERTRACSEEIARLQDMLMAGERHAVLILFQAMDGSAKDGTIKSVMSSLDPQGARAHNCKEPSAAELKHDYLWRFVKELPERGQIGIFNRSYYEEVLVTRVHPDLLTEQKLPGNANPAAIWKRRYTEINNFERYMVAEGTIILKFFLHLSFSKQRERLLDRIARPEKRWKFSMSDIEERARWDKYMKAYEEMLSKTSTKDAPWFVIPADHRWFTALAVAETALERLQSLKLSYPKPDKKSKQEFAEAERLLLNEA